jgi:hypothetical protein
MRAFDEAEAPLRSARPRLTHRAARRRLIVLRDPDAAKPHCRSNAERDQINAAASNILVIHGALSVLTCRRRPEDTTAKCVISPALFRYGENVMRARPRWPHVLPAGFSQRLWMSV